MVPAIPGLGGGVLPYRRTVLAVVRDLHLEHGIGGNQTADGDGAERDLGICLHRLRQRDAGGGDGLRKGERLGDGGLAIGHGNGHGMTAVRNFLEIFTGDGEAIGGLAGRGVGALGRSVHLFGDSQGVHRVLIIHGVRDGEAVGLRAEVGCAGGRDGRRGVVIDRALGGRSVAGLSIIAVVRLDTVHHGGPALGDGVGVGQRIALVHLRVGGATIGAALQNVAAQVAIAVTGRSPRDYQRAAALDIIRHRDGRRRRRGIVVDHRYLRTGAPARLQTLGVVCLDAVHHGRGTEGDVVRGAGGRTLINLTPRTAAVGRTLYLVAGEIALSIRAFCPRD